MNKNLKKNKERLKMEDKKQKKMQKRGGNG